VQNEYLIDRHRVIHDTGIGWHCVCAEFAKLCECRHTRESAGRLAAQELIQRRAKPEPGVIVLFSNRLASGDY